MSTYQLPGVVTLTQPSPSTEPIAPPKPHVQVRCMARTRIPTPHGPAFLHIYTNDRDNKEHLALVIDSAQFPENSGQTLGTSIRSQTLDAVWDENETEMDRIIRGAYLGRLSPTSQQASDPSFVCSPGHNSPSTGGIPAPLVRVHSECFTGETVGSMRCDCGEQLDEAIRLISQPVVIPSTSFYSSSNPTTVPGRGAIVYLRQEGRGIGLLSKIRAYNLQDLGHDTVTANLMLGHEADERGYEVACAILRDLGLGGAGAGGGGSGIRVLTNNPDKVEALQKEGLRILERVPMVPRCWQGKRQQQQQPSVVGGGESTSSCVAAKKKMVVIEGATLIGGNAVYGDDLDRYLRTKVMRMGHMLEIV